MAEGEDSERLEPSRGNVYIFPSKSAAAPLAFTALGEATAPPKDETTMTGPTREEFDAKLAASEARSDARYSDMMRQVTQHIDDKFDAKFSTLVTDVARMDARMLSIEGQVSGTKSTVIVTAIASVLAIMAVILATMAYGSQWFGLGMDASAMAQQAAERALAQQAQKAPMEQTKDGAQKHQ